MKSSNIIIVSNQPTNINFVTVYYVRVYVLGEWDVHSYAIIPSLLSPSWVVCSNQCFHPPTSWCYEAVALLAKLNIEKPPSKIEPFTTFALSHNTYQILLANTVGS